MKGCTPYQIDPLADEARRPGFNAILEEVRTAFPDRDEDELRGMAKELWHSRNK